MATGGELLDHPDADRMAQGEEKLSRDAELGACGVDEAEASEEGEGAGMASGLERVLNGARRVI